MDTEILIQQLKTKDFAVFGTGFVAGMFYEALKETGLSSGLTCCIVSKAGEGETFHGRPVYSAGSFRLPNDMMLCIAVHESAFGEISDKIKSISERCVWVYPNLYELLYGIPAQPPHDIVLADLLSKQSRDEYWLALRYAAIRDYLKNEPCYRETKDLYIKLLALHCSNATAVRRSMQMEKLAVSMAHEGFRNDCPIAVDERGRIIDGLHRTACAAFLHISKIPAVIYPESKVYDRLLGKKNRLPEDVLTEAGVTASEMQFLINAMDEMLER